MCKTTNHATRFVVTTPWSESDAASKQADELALWFHCKRVVRNARSIVKVCRDEAVEACLIADEVPKFYHMSAPDKALYFHPGMAMQRCLQLERGQSDRLLTAAGVRLGDTVVDATLGLGTDSLVLAFAVGDKGRVESLEVSEPLAILVSFAIHKRAEQPDWMQPLLERIRVHVTDYLSFLQMMPTDSVDIVYFDPMFRSRSHHPSSADALREYADSRALSEAAIREAKRVARRRVVVKERISSGVFERFGLRPDKERARFSYGILNVR
ncbi:class I SAM-dependent methyltransferase [Alicyclobacillus sp. SO9]|uniref:class I SAM-dependent methyltransferase n=1 Tax=Alicyclobacillus sp. SO9 TaxID=2665646 RepID=UPI0018E7CF40|nr:class I SAM-dependent methyltransferase [Alicyclobacillus sp. SO9]QQE80969.1 class I SAM-dependent methyltransferase [Alicyclobacillus sp. SO9]